MNGATLELIVYVAELVARLLPGAIQIGESLVDAIRGNVDLTDDQKSALVARVTATRAAVAAYRPLPPKPTAPD